MNIDSIHNEDGETYVCTDCGRMDPPLQHTPDPLCDCPPLLPGDFVTEQGVTLYCGNCLDYFPDAPVDCVVADPPYNAGVSYDGYPDHLPDLDYRQFTRFWIYHCKASLRENGSFWIAIPDQHAENILGWAATIGLRLHSWVIWYFKFGNYTSRKFSRNHTHLLWFVNGSGSPVWNPSHILVPSERQHMGDKRAEASGRVPGSVWEFPRVCGTHKERMPWHPTQLPEALLDRIILCCTRAGDTVWDPFAGTGVTGVVAARRDRRAILCERSPRYTAGIRNRLALSCVDKFRP